MRTTLTLVSAIAFISAFAMAQNHCYNANNGGYGLCVLTSDCKKNGGTYASGYCPQDGADVKCCNYGECKVPFSGVPSQPYLYGVCYPTADCAKVGGTSAKGYCPGPSDVQCCYE